LQFLKGDVIRLIKMSRKTLANAVQLELRKTGSWGGKRKGAGRKRNGSQRQTHRTRPVHKARFPLHVTLRIRRDLPSLRHERRFARIKRAFRYGCDAFGTRMCDFSVQADHIHLIVEAADKQALSKGMAALEIRVARAINRVLGRTGPVFADRYHARPLRTPTEVRHAVHYVRYNWQHHGGLSFDPFSSLCGFACWYDDEFTTVASPQTWLLKTNSS
jgi:REP element-mobilizing transposase RayT